MSTLGSRIEHLRKSKRLSREELSNRLKVQVKLGAQSYKQISRITLFNIEHDKHTPTLETLIAICEFFDVSLDWIVYGERRNKN